MGSKETQDFVRDITAWLEDVYEHHATSETRLEIIKAVESIVKAAILVGVFEPADDCDDGGDQ